MAYKLLTAEQFAAACKGIRTSGAGLNTEIQTAAVAAVGYAILHGDVRPARKLLDSMPKGMRVQTLTLWLTSYGNLAVDGEGMIVHERKFGPDDFEPEVLMAEPWHGAKKVAAKVAFDPEVEFGKFLARATKARDKDELSEAQLGLVEALQEASARFHADAALKAAESA